MTDAQLSILCVCIYLPYVPISIPIGLKILIICDKYYLKFIVPKNLTTLIESMFFAITSHQRSGRHREPDSRC